MVKENYRGEKQNLDFIFGIRASAVHYDISLISRILFLGYC